MNSDSKARQRNTCGRGSAGRQQRSCTASRFLPQLTGGGIAPCDTHGTLATHPGTGSAPWPRPPELTLIPSRSHTQYASVCWWLTSTSPFLDNPPTPALSHGLSSPMLPLCPSPVLWMHDTPVDSLATRTSHGCVHN